jgi:DNA-binding MarR family transcriptional regulator/cell division protein FtsB
VKEDILKYLSTVAHSSVKTLADRLGYPVLDVSRELNAMIKDGTVEREMRKGEYAYWLTRADAKPAEKVANGVEARSKSLIEAFVKAADAVPPKVVKPEVETSAVPELRDLLNLLGVSEDSRFKLIDAVDGASALIRERNDLREMHKTTAENFCIYRDAAVAEIESLKAANAKLKENTAALERSIDDLTGVANVQLPKVYVTVGKAAPAKRHGDLLKAQRRAAVLVRTEKESEVLVLAPVGRMVRGSEWREQ